MPRLLTLLFIAALLLPGQLWAQKPDKLTLPEQADIRIIVDISGSMKQTDPNDLRQPAVRLLARVIPEGSTAGVWTFGRYVNMLVPHAEVTESWRQIAIDNSREINSVALRTNLGKAIEIASDGYITGGSLKNTHFILLTDGKVDISDTANENQAEEERILGGLVGDLAAQGATFHPVALSEWADTDFLKTLAEKTQGSFRMADTAEALNLAFLDALNSASPQEQIPLKGDVFAVDEGVKEFTALIFRGKADTAEANEPGSLELIQPDGRALSQSTYPDNVRWAHEAAYDLVTITSPQVGEWRLKGELGEGSRVTVVSDLRMVVAPVPATFTARSPVNVRVAFFEGAEKITSPDFLDVLRVELNLTSEDGRSGSKALSAEQPPEDGEYTDTISRLPDAGRYQIDIIADGKTFARKFTATTEFIMPAAMVESTIEAPIDISLAEAPGGAAEPAPEPEPKTEQAPVPVEQNVPGSSEPDDPVLPAEEPVSLEENQEQESSFSIPLWMAAVGAGVLTVIAILVFLLMRKRRDAPQAAVTSSDEEAESLSELHQEMEEAEAEVPIVTAEEPEETIPELIDPVKCEEEEEFGLDDFDLSDFDDLPEPDSSGEPEKGDEPDDEQKK